jgi:hypothetical protein
MKAPSTVRSGFSPKPTPAYDVRFCALIAFESCHGARRRQGRLASALFTRTPATRAAGVMTAPFSAQPRSVVAGCPGQLNKARCGSARHGGGLGPCCSVVCLCRCVRIFSVTSGYSIHAMIRTPTAGKADLNVDAKDTLEALCPAHRRAAFVRRRRVFSVRVRSLLRATTATPRASPARSSRCWARTPRGNGSDVLSVAAPAPPVERKSPEAER